jgi:hypothetical protein
MSMLLVSPHPSNLVKSITNRNRAQSEVQQSERVARHSGRPTSFAYDRGVCLGLCCEGVELLPLFDAHFLAKRANLSLGFINSGGQGYGPGLPELMSRDNEEKYREEMENTDLDSI